MRSGLVAGVDSSTSACKVRVHDAETGALVASGRAPHPPTTPPRSEQDPRAWARAFSLACDRAGVRGASRPSALSVAAQQHGLVVVDTEGAPLRPAKLWNDTESAPDRSVLLEALGGGPAAWAAACGSVPGPSFTVTKLKWLRRCEPDVLERAAGVLLPHDWLTWHLTGRPTTDRGDASGTGYWSPSEGRYRLDLLRLVHPALDWPALLPDVRGPAEPAGEWSEIGAVVGPGTGDNMAAALGLGLRPGDLMLSFGTSATACTVSGSPSQDPSGVVAGFADATGRYLPLVCTMNGTKVIDTVSQLLGADRRRFDRMVLEAPPGAGGLVLVPHFDGERTPDRPEGTGMLAGIRNDVSASHLARAAVEGVVCNLLAGADALGVPWPEGRVFLVGGAAQSPAFRQVVADLTGAAVTVPEDSELVATGAALQAAAVLTGSGLGALAEAWSLGVGTRIGPHPSVDRTAIRARYAEALNGTWLSRSG